MTWPAPDTLDAATPGVCEVSPMNRIRSASLLLALVGVVVAANVLTNTLGLVSLLGLTATAGTWVAGLSLLARDGLQEVAGRRWTQTIVKVATTTMLVIGMTAVTVLRKPKLAASKVRHA